MATRLRILVILSVVFFSILGASIAYSQQGAPYPPTLVAPANGVTIRQEGFTLCIIDNGNPDGTGSRIQFEIFQSPMGDFQIGWFQTNGKGKSFCTPPMYLWKDGHYTWHARAIGPGGQSGASPDWTFTLITGNNRPTQVPRPNDATPTKVNGPNTYPDAQQEGVPGGLKLIVVTYLWGYGDIHNDNGKWDGWVMTGNGKPDRRLTMDDFNAICSQVYGPSYKATRLSDDKYAIRCVQNGSSVQNPPQGGNSGQTGSGNTSCGPNASRLHPGDIALVSDFDPNPLFVYNERNTGSGVKFTVPIREQMSIIQGASCANGVTWVEVGYHGNSGWAIEVNSYGNYNLIPNGIPLPGPGGRGNNSTQTPVPTAVPPTPVPPTVRPMPTATPEPSTAQKQPQAKIDCGELGFVPQLGGIDVYAAEVPDISAYKGQCTYHVMARYYGLLVCWLGMPTAYQWADYARYPSQTPSRRTDCVVAIDPPNGPVSSGNPAKLDRVRQGDIVVFNPGCAGADPSAGHVAILVGVSGNQMTYDEDNVGEASHTRGYDLTCMTFFRIPDSLKYSMGSNPPSGSQPGQGNASGSTTATGIIWSFCVACTSQAWVTFALPHGHYSLDGYRVTFMGSDIPVEDKSVTPSLPNDVITIHVSAQAVQDQLNQGHTDTNVLSNWRLYYTVTN